MSETHETLVNVMSCHQDDVVKNGMFDESLDTHTAHELEQLTGWLVVSRGNNACLMTNGR